MRLGYIVVYVRDVEATVLFYERAFALARRFVTDSGYAEMETGGTALSFASEQLAHSSAGAFQPVRPTDDAPGFEVAFTTPDVEGAYARAVAAGATPVRQPIRKEWGQTIAYVRDLNGALVELCSPLLPR